MIVELTLGYGEADREAQKMLSLHQLFSQDPRSSRCTRWRTACPLKKVLEQQGILNVDEY